MRQREEPAYTGVSGAPAGIAVGVPRASAGRRGERAEALLDAEEERAGQAALVGVGLEPDGPPASGVEARATFDQACRLYQQGLYAEAARLFADGSGS